MERVFPKITLEQDFVVAINIREWKGIANIGMMLVGISKTQFINILDYPTKKIYLVR